MAGDTEKIHQMMDFLTTPATKTLAGLPSPRFVKTHLPMSLLPPKLLETVKVLHQSKFYLHTSFLNLIFEDEINY